MPSGSVVRSALAVVVVSAAAAVTAGCADSADPGLTLRPIGKPLPTHIDRLPAGLSASPRSASCRAASVAHSKPQRYSLLVTLQNFLDEPPKSLPVQYITLAVRIHTATHTYTTYLQNLYEIGYEPPRVQINVDAISERGGGFGYGGVYVPLPTSVSMKLLMAGRERNYEDYDPATTLTLDEPPTSCDIIVNGGYVSGQAVDIPLVP